MKKYFLLVILALLSITAFTQPNKFQASLTMSADWPMEKFGSDDFDDPEAGLAKNGFTMDIETAYYLNHRFSFAGMILFGTNQVSSGLVGQKLEARVLSLDPALENIFENKPENLSFNVNYWLYGSFMVGPRYSFPISNCFLDFKALGGFNVTFLPEQELFAEIRNQQNVVTEIYGTQSSRNSDLSLSALAGADLRIPVRERFSLKFSVNYFYSEAKMTLEDVRIDNPGENAQIFSLNKATTTIPLSTLNTGIGLVYYF